jgi:bifunctional UDP-N-acetylglucosamine pyrophosphorylase/glucosamine-1-phosphate N-acetyltransferase
LQTVILAGGTGRRVFPLAGTKPKPMFEILGKPLIQRVIETIKEAGLRDFLVVIGHKGEQIKDYLADGRALGVNIEYAVQREALGMADALESARDLVEDSFLLVNADDVFENSLIRRMIKKFKENSAEIILSCKPVEETWKFGIIRRKNDRVTDLVEKPPKGQELSNLAVIGIYIMTKRIFDYYKKVPLSDAQHEEAIQRFIQDKNIVGAIDYDGFFTGYKYPWDLFVINEYFMNAMIKEEIIEEGVDISDRARVEGRVWIRKGTRILPGTCINGPAYIGPNTIIGNNCLVRDYSSIGKNCVVGFSSEIKRSLVGHNCYFHMNFVGDSIVSDGCMFGAGTITANMRFDQKTVGLKVDGKNVDSGRKKLGAIVGDNCRTGVNACLAPGVRIGPYSIVGAGVSLQTDLEPGKIVFQKNESLVTRENELTVSLDERKRLEETIIKYERNSRVR